MTTRPQPPLAEVLFAGRDLDELIPIAQCAAELPGRRPGKRAHVRVVERWCKVGRRGVVLLCFMLGARRYVRRRDVAAFLDAKRPAPASQATRGAASKGGDEARRQRLHRAAAALLGGGGARHA